MKVGKHKLISRFLSLVLSGLLVVNPLAASWVLAVDEEITAEVLAPPAEESPEGNQEEVISPAETGDQDSQEVGQAAIETGDAQSEAEIATTANVNLDCLEGEVATPDDSCAPPEIEVEGGGEEGTFIGNDNTADVTNEATSSATTGENEITGAEGDSLIDTGDATASAGVENEVNTNLVVLKDEEPEDPDETEESTPSALIVQNENDGSSANEVDVLAGTGENKANKNEGQAVIATGEALALANLLNLLNTNIVGSDFKVLLLNSLESQEGDINLHEVWQKLLEEDNQEWEIVEKDGQFFLVINENAARLINDVEVTASSGDNQANGNEGGAQITTGDAAALANVVNLVNLNLFGSDFFLGVLNILGDYVGNLVLPRPEKFASGAEEEGSQPGGEPAPIFQNSNQAQVDNQVETSAETGNNEADNNSGGGQIETGAAQSQANSMVLANTSIYMNDWFFLIINHLGSWTGRILGWSSPEAEEPAGEGTLTTFMKPLDQEGDESFSGPGEESMAGVVGNDNEASLETNLKVNASTGQNQASGNKGAAAIKTGQATALANLFDLVNLNIIGSRWFLGLVNILGDWTGNVVFAYPDVEIGLTNGSGEVTVGEVTEYTLGFKNKGYDKATNVWLEINLPQGVKFLNDSSGLTPQISGQNYSWFLGDLDVGEEGGFEITVQIEPDFSPQAKVSFWGRVKAKLIPVARAAEKTEGSQIIVWASIETVDPESDLSNNQASVATLVYPSLPAEEEPEEEPGTDPRQPKLIIEAWNNVGEFVYPGDIVTFEITIKNSSDVPAYDAYLLQELFNGIPKEGFGSAAFNLGTIEPGKQLTLSFGLKLNGGTVLPPGLYHSMAQAFGNAPNGEEVASNESGTELRIKWREIAPLFEAKASGKEEEVLGLASRDDADEEIFPYLLAFLVSSLWLVDKSRKKLKLLKKEAS